MSSQTSGWTLRHSLISRGRQKRAGICMSWGLKQSWSLGMSPTLLAEPLSPLWGLEHKSSFQTPPGKLCLPNPTWHCWLSTCPPGLGVLGSAVGFSSTLNQIPTAQRFVPLPQAVLHNSASSWVSKSSNSLEISTGITLTQSNPSKILWAFAASSLFSIFELLNLGTAVDRCLED